jgi:hypothetical protein
MKTWCRIIQVDGKQVLFYSDPNSEFDGCEDIHQIVNIGGIQCDSKLEGVTYKNVDKFWGMTQDVIMHIEAKNIKHAEKVAHEQAHTHEFMKKYGGAWSYSVNGVLYGHQPFKMNPPKVDETSIRLDERKKLAKSIKELGTSLIVDPKSDGVDGHVGSCLLEVAETIDTF